MWVTSTTIDDKNERLLIKSMINRLSTHSKMSFREEAVKWEMWKNACKQPRIA